MFTRVSLKLGADLFGRLMQIALLIVAARSLDPSVLGDYAFAATVGVVLGQISDFGLQLSLLHTLSAARSPEEASRAFAETLIVRCALAIATIPVGIVAAFSLGRLVESSLTVAVLILSIITASLADVAIYVFRAYGRIALEAGLMFGSRVLLGGLGAVALVSGYGLAGLSAAYAFTAIATVSAGLALTSRYVLAPMRPRCPRFARPTLLRAVPIGVSIVAWLLYVRSDILLLQWLRGADDVAAYTVAHRLFEGTLLVPTALLVVTFPGLVRAAEQGDHFRTYGLRLVSALAGLALIIVTIGVALAPHLTSSLFGAAYGVSVGPLTLLLLATVPLYMNYGLSYGFIALDRPWYNAALTMVALLVNLVSNLVLIPMSGPQGAAAATVLAEVVLLILGGAAMMHAWSRRRVAAAAGGGTPQTVDPTPRSAST